MLEQLMINETYPIGCTLTLWMNRYSIELMLFINAERSKSLIFKVYLNDFERKSRVKTNYSTKVNFCFRSAKIHQKPYQRLVKIKYVFSLNDYNLWWNLKFYLSRKSVMRTLIKIGMLTIIFVISKYSNDRMQIYFSTYDILYKLNAYNIEYTNVNFVNGCLFNKSLFLFVEYFDLQFYANKSNIILAFIFSTFSTQHKK